MNKFKLLILFFLILSYNSSYSQWAIMKSDADSLVRVGIQYIYNVEFDRAHECFVKIINFYPKHPAGYFLDAMIDWWKITLFRDTKIYDQSFENKIQNVINICDNLLYTNPKDINALFFKAGALGYRARFYTQKQDWFKAIKDGVSAYNLMIECQIIAPGNHDIMLGTGIYNYFSVAIPEQFPFTKPLLTIFPKGDRQLGIYQLRASSKLARYTAIEARVILLQIYYTFEKDNDLAHSIAEELFTKFPNNAYFHRYLARILVRKGLYEEFEQMWRDILIKCMDKKPGYDRLTAREAMYYIGLALMRNGELNEALKYFKKSEEGSLILDKDEESGFLINTIIYIANIYERLNNKKEAINYYKKALKFKDYENSHSKARESIKRLQ